MGGRSLGATAPFEHRAATVQQLAAGEFRRTLGEFATGVTVISVVAADGRKHGITATSFGSLSLDPPLIQWSLRRTAWSHGVFGAAASFAVNILAADQEGVSRTFCQPDVDRFGLTPHRLSGLGLPLIEGAAVWLECALEAQLPGGDHTIFVGRVLTSSVFERAPLLHWRGGYQVLQAL